MKTSLLTESTRVHVAMYEPRISIIQEVVANYYGLTVDETKAHIRKGSSIKARQRVHYFCKELLPRCPLAVIGFMTGNGQAFDHSTILHGHKSIYKEMTFKNRAGVLVYPDVLAQVTVLRDEIMRRFEAARQEPRYFIIVGMFTAISRNSRLEGSRRPRADAPNATTVATWGVPNFG